MAVKRAGPFKPTVRVDYATRRPAVKSMGLASSRVPVPSSWRKLSYQGCDYYLPPGFDDYSGSKWNNGAAVTICGGALHRGSRCNYPPRTSGGKVTPIPPTLIMGAGILPGINLPEAGFLPDTRPCPWFKFSSDSVARGGTIDLESNLAFGSAKSQLNQWNPELARRHGGIDALVVINSQPMGAKLIGGYKLRIYVPSNYRPPANGWLFGMSKANASMLIRCASAKNSDGSIYNIGLQPAASANMIRLTGTGPARFQMSY